MGKLERFIELLENEVKNGSIYVWGGQGQAATETIINKLETSEENKNRAKALLKKRIKAGCKLMRAFDCSGLVTKLMEEAGIESKGFDTTAQGLRKNYCDSIRRADLKPGDLVFRKNTLKTYHVGVVVDDKLNVIEAKGRDYGVVKRGLEDWGKAYWNAYARPKKLKAEIEQKNREVLKRLLKKKTILMKGEDVKKVQQKLMSLGYSCGKDGADGKYGKNTVKAVKAFQKVSGLKTDGIVGENTAVALGFEYKA